MSYAFAPTAPTRADVSAYVDWLSQRWPKVLDTHASNEKAIQEFLERHPCMVPGFKGVPINEYNQGWLYDIANHDGFAHNGPIHHALFTQPRFAGYDARIADFMWLNHNSASFEPTFVEIETPAKRWFNKDGTTSQALNHTMDQLADWRLWLEDHGNRRQFARFFKISPHFLTDFSFRPRFILVMGRRDEFSGNPRLNQKRGTVVRDWISRAMTFDALIPFEQAAEYGVVTFQARTAGFQLKGIPPTLQLGPAVATAKHYDTFASWEGVLDNAEFLSKQRRDFLRERIPYWAGVHRAHKIRHIPSGQVWE